MIKGKLLLYMYKIKNTLMECLILTCIAIPEILLALKCCEPESNTARAHEPAQEDM